MRRSLAVIGVILLLVTSGCAGFLGGSNQQSATTETSTDSTTALQQTIKEPTQAYTVKTDTRDLALDLVNTTDNYRLHSEKIVRNESEQRRVHHSQIFILNNTSRDLPQVVSSNIIIYNSSNTAEQRFLDILQNYSDASQTKISITKGVNATKIQITEDNARKVIVVKRIKNSIVIVATIDQEKYYSEKALEFFSQILVNYESYETSQSASNRYGESISGS